MMFIFPLRNKVSDGDGWVGPVDGQPPPPPPRLPRAAKGRLPPSHPRKSSRSMPHQHTFGKGTAPCWLSPATYTFPSGLGHAL